jgi:hypothetical protein
LVSALKKGWAMQKRTSRRLRFVVVFMVACIVALVTGATLALADVDTSTHGGPPPDPKPCSLEIKKVLVDAPHGTDYHDFSVQVEYPDGSKQSKSFGDSSKSATFEVKKAGDYKITEVNVPANFTVGYSTQTVTFSADDISRGDKNKSATITNTYVRPPEPCTLKVTKSLVNAPHGTDYDDFTVQVQYPDASTKAHDFSNSGSHKAEFSVTVAGSYTITEINIL